MEQSKSLIRPTSIRPTPIACRVCDKIFFDNVSLVFHFESHLEDKTSTTGQPGEDMVSLHGIRNSSSSLSPFSCSSIGRTNLVPSPLGQESSPGDTRFVFVAAQHAVPPMSAAFSLPVNHSTMFKKRAVTSSTYPLIYSQLGARNLLRGLGEINPMMLNVQYGKQGRFYDCNNLQVRQSKNPDAEEIVVVSDDEDDKKNDDKIDLSLKL